MGLAHDLFEFAGEQPSMGGFATFVAAFDALPFPSSIDDFHAQLFGQLQHLAEVDEFDWDPTVSSDPRSSEFEFSFAGRAWFVVGFTPNSPRVARRFLSPLLIFNAHEQFEQLRADGKYTGMQKSIRRRDQRLQPGGQPNPMLADTGESPAWRQFSGQMLPEDAQCPFETRREQQ